jgi:enoyl-CoA hydratase
MPTEEQPIAIERHGDVAVLTLDNPANRNALTNEVLEAIAGGIDELEADGARCVVLAGAEKVFASGADIRTLAAATPLELYYGRRGELWARLRRIRVPMVAAVSGFCLGGGLELAMYCDVIVASRSARFGLPETKLGVIPGAGGTQLLPRAIGRAKAMDVILAGRLLDAEEAERAGLVSRVVDQEDWRSTAEALAADIASRAPLAQRLAKEAATRGLSLGLDAGIDAERTAFALALGSADAKEGIAAFLEKRDPDWQGK